MQCGLTGQVRLDRVARARIGQDIRGAGCGPAAPRLGATEGLGCRPGGLPKACCPPVAPSQNSLGG